MPPWGPEIPAGESLGCRSPKPRKGRTELTGALQGAPQEVIFAGIASHCCPSSRGPLVKNGRRPTVDHAHGRRAIATSSLCALTGATFRRVHRLAIPERQNQMTEDLGTLHALV